MLVLASVRRPVLRPARGLEKEKTMPISAAPILTTGQDATFISKPGGTNIPIINDSGARAKKGTNPRPSALRYKPRSSEKQSNLQRKFISLFVRYKPRSFFNALGSLLKRLLSDSKDPEIQAEIRSKVMKSLPLRKPRLP
jgi:hypothetical protein